MADSRMVCIAPKGMLPRMLVRNGGPAARFEIVHDPAYGPLSDHLPVAAHVRIGAAG